MIKLPPELIEAIIDEVSPQDSKDVVTLTACSLVARALLVPSQRHLFRSLTLNMKTLVQGSRVFVDSPHIVSYIRDLHLVDAWFGTDSNREVLTLLFPLLDNLCRLAIWSTFSDWEWNTLPVDFHAVLVGILSVPSLRFLGLARCTGIPSSIIRHALLTCKEVSLRDIGIFSEDEVFPYANQIVDGSGLSHCSLDYLAISYRQKLHLSIPVYALLLGEEMTPHLTRLRHLELPLLQTGSLGDGVNLVRMSSSSLQHLVINSRGELFPSVTEFPKLLRLRSLTLKARSCKNWVPPGALTTIASLPTCTPNIEIINVFVDFALWNTPPTARPEVDEALQNLPHLRRANFHITRRPGGNDIESGTRQILPLANDAGLLAFSKAPYLDLRHPFPK
ncbi:hypothetical protein B0H19DRAFT_1109458 [Mycena capillaripes]|nr:hypothetical protein B0H19DRAFT_1109458 [Mycena capillaripes]